MKKIALMLLAASVSFSSFGASLEQQAKSGNITAAYQLAQLYENKNDIKNALFWYKQAAKLSLQNQANTSTANSQVTDSKPAEPLVAEVPLDLQVASNQDSKPRLSDRVAMHKDYVANNGAFEFIDSTFGLRPYHSNHILPLTYDSQSHNDGRKHTETTFQLSFKKDVFTNTFGFDETIGFAYTQRNWWQTTEDSSPFRETNYLPELYVQVPNSDPNGTLKGAQFGFLHESNGQGNEAGKSRSWNRLYLEGYLRYQESYIVPRVWYRIYENRKHDDNHNIQSYLGYGDLSLFIPYEKNLIKILFRNNLNFNNNRGAVQIDWTYPLGESGLFGYVQYFNGYGESLIDYNKQSNRLGIGIALSR